MRIWTLLMISVLMLAFTMPVMACDACNKDGPTIGINLAFDDTVYQPVMATNKMNMPSPYDVLEQTMPAPCLVVTPYGPNDQEGTDYASLGGDSLRRTGRPMALG